MKLKLLICACIAILGINQALLAQTTINTNLTATTTTSPGGVTFVVDNTNSYPIRITNVGYYVSTSDNGQLYTLYYSNTSISGPQPTAWPDPAWPLVGSATVNGVTATGIQNIINGLAFVIPPNTTYRFSLHKGTTIPLYASSGANTFSAAGVNLFLGNYQISGQNVGYAYTITPRYWAGSITFEPASPPAPIISGGGSYCSGDDITVKVAPPTGYDTTDYSFFWTFPNGTTSTDSILNFPNAQAGASGPSGIYTVYMLVDTGAGPPDTSAVTSVTVFVQQVPPPPTVARLITYCQNSPADTIPIHGQNIKWYSVDTGGTAMTTQPVINTGTPGSFTYYVSQTFGGCESARVPVTVQVVPQAPPPTVTSPVTYCQNDVAVALQAVGQNLLWYSTDTGGVGTPIVPVPSTLAQGTFYWYVTQTIDGCESVRVPVEIRINYRPNALILGSRPFVCEGDTLSFSYYGNADGDVNVNFNWDWPSGATIVSGSGQGPYVIRFDSAGARTIRLVVDNDGCMSPEALFHIEVRPLPVFSLEVPEQACQGDIVNLVINQATPGIDSFVWSIDGGEKVYASETAGPYGVRWNEAGQKTITVVGTDRTCKAAPVSDVINIRWLPDATISTPNGTGVCAGDSILVEGVYNPEYTYQWLPEQYFIENNGYRQWARIDYAREITLNVTDVYNCKSSSSIWVTPQNCCVVSFPTAFTPNSDGRNDVFRPITQGNQKITSFVVKNRWGQQVFESADDRLGWDGRFGGSPQDMGTYFYYIKYQCSDGKFYEEKGEVMLVR